MMIQERLKRSNFILLLDAGVVVGLTLLRAYAGLWRAGGRGYLPSVLSAPRCKSTAARWFG